MMFHKIVLFFLLISSLLSSAEISLSQGEKEWRGKNYTVRVRVAFWPPYQIHDNGKLEGYSVDIITEIFNKYGIKYELISSDTLPWTEALESIKNREKIDILLTAKITEDRKKHMLFTDNYISSPWVIFTKSDETVANITALEGKTVAVQKGYVVADLIQEKYPKIKLKLFSGGHATEDAVKAVATGEVDAFIGNLATGSYVIKELQLSNVKVAVSTPFGEHENAMAIRSDWPELVSLINKELRNLSAEEKSRMLDKYLSLRYEFGIDVYDVLKWILITSLIFGTIIFIVIRSNRKLNAEIVKRKAVESKLQHVNKSLLEAQQIAHFGSWEYDIVKDRLTWSDEVYKIFGIEPGSIVSNYENFLTFVHPDDREMLNKTYSKSLENQTNYHIQHRVVRRDGSVRYVEEYCVNEYDNKGKPLRSVGSVYDITSAQEVKIKLERYNEELEKQVKKEVLEKIEIEQEKMNQERILIQQAKMAEVGEMLGVIIHQWKQPLNIINLSVQEMGYINQEVLEEPNQDLNVIEETVLKQVKFMSETMNYFRNFFSPVDKDEKFLACEVIGNIKEMFRGAFEKKDVSIEIMEHEHFNSYGKKNEFSQVILNILNNAKDALIEKDIQDKRIICSFEQSEKYNIIKIRDNAGGIPDELLPDKLFNAYVTTKGEEGTGIGMNISKVIIEDNLKGKLWAHNVDAGAEFVIELPKLEEDS